MEKRREPGNFILQEQEPEAGLEPDREAVLANGLSEPALGIYVDALMDGLMSRVFWSR